MIFMKLTKTGKAFLYCEELIVVTFAEKNVDAHLIQSQRKQDSCSKLLSHIFRDQSKVKYSSSPIGSINGNLRQRLKIRLKN